MMKKNIVFFGSGVFAVEVLKEIDRSCFEIRLVVTQPDRQKGRHLQTAATPVKTYAQENGLDVFQPQDINSRESIEMLKFQAADIFLVVSYGRILSQAVLEIPRLAVNIHSSLLPRYRGAAPVNWALMKNEKKTGVTFIKMNACMDQGDILVQKMIPVGARDHARSLDEKLARLAAGLVNTVLKDALAGRLKPKKQDHKKATFAPLICKHHGLIQWDKTSREIYNGFRGCYGWPGSYTHYKGKVLKILDLKVGRNRAKAVPGTVLKAKDNELEIACSHGSVVITEVLPESHKKMSVASFLAGHPVKVGEVLG
ncbi:MAG: methionyl-tRNA formyltransferase [Candidatus Omnitrophota bacterium]